MFAATDLRSAERITALSSRNAHRDHFEHEANVADRIYETRPLTCQRSQSVMRLTGCKIGFE